MRIAARKAHATPHAERRANGGAETSKNECGAFLRAPGSLPKRRLQQSPQKAASIARRRRLAASGGLPPRIAEHFTVSEQAALRIVLDAVCECVSAA